MEENKEEKVKEVKETKKEEQKNKTVEKKSTPKKKVEDDKTVNDKNAKEEPKKDDTTFKKVERNTSEEKNKKEEKGSHKFFKAILIVILILIAAYCIFFCRNLIILKNLKEAASQYAGVTNYSYKSTGVNGEGESYFTYSQKDNLVRIELQNDQNESANVIIWQDQDANQEIVAFPEQNTAVRSTKESFNSLGRLPFTLLDMGDKIDGIALYAWIYTDTVMDKECYVIQMSSQLKIWIEKDTGLVYRQDSNENIYTEITSLEINNVNEIYTPDLTGYEVRTNETNTEVAE